MSQTFELLHPGVQRHIWSQGWTQLRPVQALAIEAVLGSSRDVVIAAETAAGKTEAAFFPALTQLLQAQDQTSERIAILQPLIVYVSPLKALINDQLGRLQLLCDSLDVPVWPWHGDISASVKARFRRTPEGVLLITPEALEATLCRRGTQVSQIFGNTLFFIIDELHAFIGSERGKQLQSLLHRIDMVAGKRIRRLGLSATLGDMQLAAQYLRSGKAADVAVVQAPGIGSNLKMRVKGFIEPRAPALLPSATVSDTSLDGPADENSDEAAQAPHAIAAELYRVLKGNNNLVFPNRRAEVERYTALLNRLCDADGQPHEFWPHHGSLSKELRAEAEQALKDSHRCATAVCTNTLELGIDIGDVKTVAQIGPPHSVASLRQRLGRSGRREGESKILRGYVVEAEAHGGTTRWDVVLRLQTVQFAAMLSLLLEGWFEPPADGLHLSTLVQQLLSLIAERNGTTAAEAHAVLCGHGAPFEGLSKSEFIQLLRHLGAKELIQQDCGGVLVHGRIGERLVNHYDFYSAFVTDDEYRLVTAGKFLGSLPISQMMRPGQHLMFAGKAWRIESIDDRTRTLHVRASSSGALPNFASGSGQVHGIVRRRMRQLLESSEPVSYFDTAANRLLNEGRLIYRQLALDVNQVVGTGDGCALFTWLGDSANEALAAWLTRQGLPSWVMEAGVSVQLSGHSEAALMDALRSLAARPSIDITTLFRDAAALQRQKWDWALPDELLFRSYASLHLDVPAAQCWAAELLSRSP